MTTTILHDRASGASICIDETDLIHDDGEDACPHCEAPSHGVRCERCHAWARIIDCGHMSQPRPIAADSSHVYCDDCADER